MLNAGIDIGGTFTDSVAIDDAGNVYVGKSPTTPERVTAGVIGSLSELASRMSLSLPEMLRDTRFLGHGTTVGTNALVTRAGARVGLITTAGFEDTPYIQRAIGRLAGLSDVEVRRQVSLRQPIPLVERHLIAGVTERVDVKGQVVIPLLESEAAQAVQSLLDRGAQAIAVCLLWSFANPVHERLVAKVLRELAPDLPVSLSCELAPKIRENARTNTVVIDAFIRGRVHDYLDDLQRELAANGFNRSVATMQCFGGVTDARTVSAIATIDSGPVGGVMAAKYLAQLLGEDNIITTDVGGTSFDVSVISRGREIMAREYFGAAGVMSRFEVLMPRVDIATIGAGGGTIARFDSASRTIKLGPDSAGSVPGPVFYGRGGTEPTLADAWLVLGYLDPDRFLGGRVTVHKPEAETTIRKMLAEPMGISVTEAAYATVELANHHMSDAIRVYMAARGLSTRDFALVAFGGGGPMHAAAYGRLSGAKRTYLIANATAFSAFGMALADTKHKQERSLLMGEPFDVSVLAKLYGELEDQLIAQFEREGLPSESVACRYLMDLRYRGQVHELTIDVPGLDWLVNAGTAEIRERFAHEYGRAYGSASVTSLAEVEVVGVGVDGVSSTPKPELKRASGIGKPAQPFAERLAHFGPSALSGRNDATFSPVQDGYVPTPVYAHRALEPDQSIDGPAIVQDDYVTMLVLPGQVASVDVFGNVVIDNEEHVGW